MIKRTRESVCNNSFYRSKETTPRGGGFFLGGFQMKSPEEEDLLQCVAVCCSVLQVLFLRLFIWKPYKKKTAQGGGGGVFS